MPGSTPSLSLPYPTPGDTVDVPRDVKALADAMDPLGVVPTGCIMCWPTAAAPTGWLFCQGQQVSAATYPRLAAVLGSAGGLVTIPNLQGRVPVGVGTATGAAGATAKALNGTGGEEKHTLAAAESGVNGSGTTAADGGAHNHTITVNQSNIGQPAGWNMPIGDSSFSYTLAGNGLPVAVRHDGSNVSYASGVHAHTAAASAVGNHGHTLSARAADSSHENMPPYLVLNYIIKAS